MSRTTSSSSKLYAYNNPRKNSRGTYTPTTRTVVPSYDAAAAAAAAAEAERQRKLKEYYATCNSINSSVENINQAKKDLTKALELLNNEFSGEKVNQLEKEIQELLGSLNTTDTQLSTMSININNEISKLGGTPINLKDSTQSTTQYTKASNIYSCDYDKIINEIVPLIDNAKESIDKAQGNLYGISSGVKGCGGLDAVKGRINNAEGDIGKTTTRIEEFANNAKKAEEDSMSLIDKLFNNKWVNKILEVNKKPKEVEEEERRAGLDLARNCWNNFLNDIRDTFVVTTSAAELTDEEIPEETLSTENFTAPQNQVMMMEKVGGTKNNLYETPNGNFYRVAECGDLDNKDATIIGHFARR